MTTKTTNHYFRAMAVLAALALAMGLLAQLAKPAEAAFPGKNSNIAFTRVQNGNSEIYQMDVAPEGSNNQPQNLTNDPAPDADPAFSPDGTEIAFMRRTEGNLEIYVMNSDGSNQTNRTNNPAEDYQPDFSPKGDKIAFASDRDNASEFFNIDVFVMNANGSNPKNLSNNVAPGHNARDWQPVFSPDGSKIAFTSMRDGNAEVYRMNSNGSNQTNLTGHTAVDGQPNWGPWPS